MKKKTKSTKRWIKGMRDVFFDTLYNIAKKDQRVILVTSDTGAICHDDFKKNLKDQYINVGIAEQNMVGIGAGLAMSGKIVYLYAIIPFATMRCFEQIRINLCCMGLNVNVVGIGAGYDYSTLGPTHHGTEDIALMRTLPGMTIYSPSDSFLAKKIAQLSYKQKGPKYIRLDRTGFPLIYSQNKSIDLSTDFSVLGKGRKLSIIATGRMVYQAKELAKDLAKYSIDTKVIDLYRIKPLNKDRLLKTLRESEYIATLEEHFITGGIGSLMAELLVENGLNLPFKRFGIPDKFSHQYGNRNYLIECNDLGRNYLVNSLRQWIKK